MTTELEEEALFNLLDTTCGEIFSYLKDEKTEGKRNSINTYIEDSLKSTTDKELLRDAGTVISRELLRVGQSLISRRRGVLIDDIVYIMQKAREVREKTSCDSSYVISLINMYRIAFPDKQLPEEFSKRGKILERFNISGEYDSLY